MPHVTPAAQPAVSWSPVSASWALGAVILAYRAWQLSQAYFWQDDFLYLYSADVSTLGMSYLLQDYHGHLMPGAFLVADAVAQLSGHRWWAAASIVMVMEALKVMLVIRTSLALFGARWGTLLPTSLLLMSPMWVTPTLWWAAALQSLPLQISVLASVWLVDRYRRRQRTTTLAATAAVYLFGLLFWEKALVVPAAAFAVTLVVSACRGSRPLRAVLLDVTRSLHRVIVVWVVITVGYLAVYLNRIDLAAQFSSTGVAADDKVAALRHSVVSFVTALAGGPWRATAGTDTLTPAPPAGAVFVAVQLVLLAGVVLLAVGGARRLVLASAATGAFLLVDAAVVSMTRLDLLGPAQASDPRYFTEALIVTAFSAGACAMGSDASQHPLVKRIGDRGPILVGVAVAVFANSAAITQQALTEVASRRGSGPWAVEAARQVADKGALDVHDGPVPEDVIGGIFGSEARASRVLADHRLPIRWNTTTSDLLIFDGLGVLRPADLKDVTLDAGAGPDPGCGWLARPGAPARIRLPVSVDLEEQPLALGHFSDRPARLEVMLDGEPREVSIGQGLNRLWIYSQGPRVRDIEVRVVQGGAVCVTEARRGTVWPRQ